MISWPCYSYRKLKKGVGDELKAFFYRLKVCCAVAFPREVCSVRCGSPSTQTFCPNSRYFMQRKKGYLLREVTARVEILEIKHSFRSFVWSCLGLGLGRLWRPLKKRKLLFKKTLGSFRTSMTAVKSIFILLMLLHTPQFEGKIFIFIRFF